MQPNSASGFGVELRKRPDEDGTSPSSTKEVKKSLSHYSLLLAPGILGSILAHVVYPPLDEGPIAAAGFGVLMFPLVLYLRSTWRNRLQADAGKLRKTFVYSSLILTTLVLVVLMNGFLDKSPRSTVTAVVLGKTRHNSRGGTDYILTVASWRPRRTSEDFQVSSFDFQRAVVGRTVRIELHKGFFNLPWSGNISPE
jgi:hypothetical protein